MGRENRALSKSLNESNPSSEHERIESLIAKLARFYSVMGNCPDEPGALALMAEILCKSGTDEQIAQSMTRCTRECRYPVRLPDLLQRVPGQEIPATEAEARRAWDELLQFVRKYVDSDVYGNYGPEHGWYPTYPKLSDRVLDTVRRTGGWAVYARLTSENFPFVQKRFFEEYAAWTAVQRVEASKVIASLPRLQLVSKSLNQRTDSPPEKSDPPVFRAKQIVTQMTNLQLRDRRELLRQQAETLQEAIRTKSKD
jgi:hypothetical protein